MRVLIGGQAHPVEAQAGHGDYLPAVVAACKALRKTGSGVFCLMEIAFEDPNGVQTALIMLPLHHTPTNKCLNHSMSTKLLSSGHGKT